MTAKMLRTKMGGSLWVGGAVLRPLVVLSHPGKTGAVHGWKGWGKSWNSGERAGILKTAHSDICFLDASQGKWLQGP